MSDQDVYQRLGAMLLGVCPAEATRIVLHAEMSESGDYLGPDVTYVTTDGDGQADVGPIVSDLHDAFIDLRQLTVGEGQQPWTTCEFVIAPRTGQFEVSFGYEDLGF